MKRFYFCSLVLFLFLFPFPISASTDVVLECLEEAMVGNEIYCTVQLNPEEKISGVFSNYEYDSMLTYYKTDLGEDWKNITNSSKGFVLTNIEGIEQKSDLAKIYFYVSNDAVPGTEYSFSLKNLQLSNGEVDISLEDKVRKIKILSVGDVIESIQVYDKQLEVKDGITSYTVTVPNEVTSVEATAILKDEKYQFAEEYAPGTFSNLKVGDNLFYLQIKKDDLILLHYEICVHRLAKIEEVFGSKEEITNPKTGSLATKIVILVLIVSFALLVILGVKKRRQVK